MYLKSSLKDTLNKQVFKDTLIQNEETAVLIAEPILFKRYGRKIIDAQNPYRVYNLNGYWMIQGSYHKGAIGGIFLIIIRPADAKIIEISLK